MSNSRVSFGLPLGCGSAIGLCALALVTGTIILNIPFLAAPVRFEITAAAPRPTEMPSPTRVAVSTAPVLPSLPQPVAVATQGAAPTAVSSNPWAAGIPAAACIPTDLPQIGLVVGVIDGRTIRVLMDRDQLVYTVRYVGTELPPSSDPVMLQRALLRNEELTDRKRLLMVRDLTDQDSNGRLSRYVLVGSTFVNYDLVAGGYLLARPSPPDSACDSAFQAAQQQAQASQLGIWSPPSPVP